MPADEPADRVLHVVDRLDAMEVMFAEMMPALPDPASADPVGKELG